MKNKTTIIGLTFMLLFFVLSCANSKKNFTGKVAKTDQIHAIETDSDSGVWNTRDLTINFSYTSSRPDHFNLKGYIVISDSIVNTYLKIIDLTVRASFLDTSGKVVGTSYIHPIYSRLSMSPEKIKFNSNISLPDEAVAFCFSYSGNFQGDDRTMGSISIDHNPFR